MPDGDPFPALPCLTTNPIPKTVSPVFGYVTPTNVLVVEVFISANFPKVTWFEIAVSLGPTAIAEDCIGK
jgi:hypothetical protein